MPPALRSGGWRVERGDRVPVALLGIAQFGILVTLLNYGLETVPAARAALLFATMPLATMLLAAALGQERITAAGLAGVLLAVLGVGITLGEPALARDGGGLAGEAAVLAASATGALCSVLYRPYLRKYPALPVGACAMLASVAFLAPPAVAERLVSALPRFSGHAWAAVGFIGASSGAGYLLWLWALHRAGATRVTAYLSLGPVTAAALGAVVLGEPVSARAWLGCGAVVVGLWLAHSARGLTRTADGG